MRFTLAIYTSLGPHVVATSVTWLKIWREFNRESYDLPPALGHREVLFLMAPLHLTSWFLVRRPSDRFCVSFTLLSQRCVISSMLVVVSIFYHHREKLRS